MVMIARGSRGNVIIATLVAITLVTSLAATVVFMALAESKASTGALDRTRALFAAEAAANLQYDSLRKGGGVAALSGTFGGVSYTVPAATALGNDCYRIESTATVNPGARNEEKRRYEIYATLQPSSPPKAAVGIQQRGDLAAVFPTTGWRVTGADTKPPSVTGAPWDSPTVGNGPQGPNAQYGMVVFDPGQRNDIWDQIRNVPRGGGNPVLLDGKSGNWMGTVNRNRRISLNLANLVPALRARPGTTVVNGSSATSTYGAAGAPVVLFLDDGAQISTDVTGYGVLVVDGSNVQIAGDLRWEGLVVFYVPTPTPPTVPPAVDFDTIVSGHTWVYGSVLIEDPNGRKIFFSANNSKIYYSSQAYGSASTLFAPSSARILATNALN